MFDILSVVIILLLLQHTYIIHYGVSSDTVLTVIVYYSKYYYYCLRIQTAGSALVDVLTGVVSPAGRLPNTWPASLDQVVC